MKRSREYYFVAITVLFVSAAVAASGLDPQYHQGENYGKSQSSTVSQNLNNPDYGDIPGYGEPYQSPPPADEMQQDAKRDIYSGHDKLGGYVQGSIKATAPTEAEDVNSQDTKTLINKGNGDAANADRSAAFCEQGNCADKSYQKNSKNDINKYASQVAAINENGISYNGNSVARQNGTAVNSREYKCRDMMIGYSNCCQDKGWGQDLHLAGCSSSEKKLGQLKEDDKCVYLGRYCSDKFLGSCTEHKKTYCCFDSILDKIIRDQGGRGQLHLVYGSAHHPSCTGLTVNQLQSIDYSKLNYSEYYSTFEEGMSNTTSQEINNIAKGDMAGLTHEAHQESGE